jgi:transcriptional regulator with XRE-family HTH domain
MSQKRDVGNTSQDVQLRLVEATRRSMQIKDQIRVRMEQLGIGVPELAKRVGVSGQTIRFWLDGRNFPSKRVLADVEKALSVKLDFSEGAQAVAAPTVSSMMERTDIELFLQINKLPGAVKVHMHRMVEAMNEALAPATPDNHTDVHPAPRRRRG